MAKTLALAASDGRRYGPYGRIDYVYHSGFHIRVAPGRIGRVMGSKNMKSVSSMMPDPIFWK